MESSTWCRVAIVAIVAARMAGAQQLRGVVRDSSIGAPLAGAVVAVLDSGGTSRGRAITDQAGRYAVAAGAGAARLHFIRIGYQPRDVDLPARRDSVLAVTMSRLPPVLELVRVSGKELCPGSTDRGAAFQLWEQARAGLLATVVAREAKPANTTTLIYESVMAPGDDRIQQQTKQFKTGRTTRPFISVAGPSFFATNGYMMEDPSGRVFNAPDADVLLHESFVATHCFHLQRGDANNPGQTGLAFSPAAGRDTLVDVNGVIWLDNTTPQLRSLDFLYTSLEPAAVKAGTGGHIEFRNMANGVSFIERWYLRLPMLQVMSNSTIVARGSEAIRRTERNDVRVHEMVEAGGVVVAASWADGTTWADSPATLNGVVLQRGSRLPIVGAVVALMGGVDTTRTDSSGAYSMAVLPGRYTVMAVDTTLLAFVAPRSDTKPVDVPRASAVRADFSLLSADEVAAAPCRRQHMGDSTIIVAGRITMGGTPPVAGSRLRATWQSDFTASASAGIGGRTNEQFIDLDDAGRFAICGVTRDQPVSMKLLWRSVPVADTVIRVNGRGRVVGFEWKRK